MSALRPRARRAPLLLALVAALLPHADRVAGGGGGGSMFGDVNISSILDSFSISYDKRVRPNYGGPPVEVGVTMYVLSISSVSEVLMDFTLDFYFRQFWTDPRLAYKKRAGVETLSVGSEFIRNIWVPDTFFVNEKQSYFHSATTSNEFIRIHHSGSITRSIRLTITASCPMNLQYFPMDRQLCHIEIESCKCPYKLHFECRPTHELRRVHLFMLCTYLLTTAPSMRFTVNVKFLLSSAERSYLKKCAVPFDKIVSSLVKSALSEPVSESVNDSVSIFDSPCKIMLKKKLLKETTAKNTYYIFGYTMTDILYVWKDGASSVGMSSEVQLPQFRVLGHRQRATVVALTTVGYTMRDIRYKWNEGPNSVGVSNEVSLPQFKVLGHRQRAMEISLTTGNYSRLACEIQFVRSMGYYLIQIYIPSGLIVIISWVSFWLNRNATPARVQLGVTTVLTMTTLMSSTNAALPKISYVKSIDVYLGTCFVMVFTSLLEYATVGYMSKRIQMRKQRFVAIQKIMSEKKLPTECGPAWEAHTLGGRQGGSLGRGGAPPPARSCPGRPPSRHLQEVRYKVRDPKAHSKGATLESTIEENPVPPLHALHGGKDIGKFLGMTPSDIDKYSRIMFPVCFVCFNLMYWIVYLHVSDVVADDLVLLEENK